MSEYYLDIETYTEGSKPNTDTDKVLTIQYQKLNTLTGAKEGDLNILKSWDSSEKDILNKFHIFFMPNLPFEFIPIGFNLKFELLILHNRWKSIGIDVPLKTLINHPHIDIRSIAVILNNGQFKGASLDKLTGKLNTGDKIKEWYNNKDYKKIEYYIVDEADKFIKLYQYLKKEIPKMNNEINKLFIKTT